MHYTGQELQIGSIGGISDIVWPINVKHRGHKGWIPIFAGMTIEDAGVYRWIKGSTRPTIRATDGAAEPPWGELARRDELFQPDQTSSECLQQAETMSVMSHGVSAELALCPTGIAVRI
ncbi:hypothetical protein GCM10022421_31050 [Oceanisphaera sediminis]|uniref:Uncharacterized protein n=1 Tax=Oceanisphaera sediminis TaxID=981381 RepID=A0ABP7ENP2_9GAMM